MEKKIVNVPSKCKAKPKQSLHSTKEKTQAHMKSILIATSRGNMCVCVCFFDPYYMEFDVCSIDLYIKTPFSTLSLSKSKGILFKSL